MAAANEGTSEFCTGPHAEKSNLAVPPSPCSPPGIAAAPRQHSQTRGCSREKIMAVFEMANLKLPVLFQHWVSLGNVLLKI